MTEIDFFKLAISLYFIFFQIHLSEKIKGAGTEAMHGT